MTTSASPSATPAHTNDAGPAARAVDLRKVYGSGDTQVAALDGVSVEFRPAQFTAIGLEPVLNPAMMGSTIRAAPSTMSRGG